MQSEETIEISKKLALQAVEILEKEIQETKRIQERLAEEVETLQARLGGVNEALAQQERENKELRDLNASLQHESASLNDELEYIKTGSHREEVHDSTDVS